MIVVNPRMPLQGRQSHRSVDPPVCHHMTRLTTLFRPLGTFHACPRPNEYDWLIHGCFDYPSDLLLTTRSPGRLKIARGISRGTPKRMDSDLGAIVQQGQFM
jgi:hypothetical protein